MNLRIVLLNFLLSSVYLNAQTDCDTFLSQKINLQYENFENYENELVHNFSKLEDCGLNKEDIAFISESSILGILVLKLIDENPETVTYQKLLNEVLIIKASADYQEMIKLYSDLQILRSKKIDINNWETDSKLILNLVQDERVVNSIYQLIANNLVQYTTYGEMIDYLNKMADSFLINNESIEGYPDFHKDSELISFAEMLDKSSESGKPLLLYFTSYSDINSRKMEDAYLYDDDIQEFIASKFYSITMYVDSKMEVPKEYISTNTKSGEIMQTYGNYYNRIQKDQFNEDSQPLFIIININGKRVKTQGFTLNKEEFFNFLD